MADPSAPDELRVEKNTSLQGLRGWGIYSGGSLAALVLDAALSRRQVLEAVVAV
ncbi:MAG: hypothetical protein ACKO5F_08565 [Synechococcus sp.]